MPQYYFDVVADGERSESFESLEVSDRAAVERMAIEGARELMAEAIRRGNDISHHAFEVRDEAGQVVLEFSFANAIARNR